MQALLSSIKELFQSFGYSPAAIAVAVLLGIFSAAASACCTLPMIGIVAGYSITRREERRTIICNGLLFMGGIIITLLAIGGVIVFAGQTIQKVSGAYWKIGAGCAALFFGIGALELFPFQLPRMHAAPLLRNSSAWIAGIIFGGAVAVSSMPCNPGIYIILGAAVLQNCVLWSLLTLIAYAIGFSVPLSLLVFGLSAGKSLIRFKKVEKVIRIIAGIILIGIAIYLFYSL